MKTLTAWINSAMEAFTNVDWIPTAQNGPSAPRNLHVLRGREIVIISQTVRELCFVVKIIVLVDQQEWTVVQMMVSKIFGNDPRQYMDLILQST